MTARDASECILKFKQMNAMPGREQNSAMPAIPSIPFLVRYSRSTERQSVQTSEVKERKTLACRVEEPEYRGMPG